MNLRADDKAVLEWIAEQTGVGTVCDHPASTAKGNAKPQTAWQVQSKAGCQRIVSILDDHPLRSKKARDYATWREAVGLWAAMTRVGRQLPGAGGSYPRDWARIAVLYDQLRQGRAYSI